MTRDFRRQDSKENDHRSMLVDLIVMALACGGVTLFSLEVMLFHDSPIFDAKYLLPVTVFAVGIGTTLLQLIHGLMARHRRIVSKKMHRSKRQKQKSTPFASPSKPSSPTPSQRPPRDDTRERIRFIGRS